MVVESLRRHLAAGVTTVRDVGDRQFSVVERRDAQRQVDDGLPWIVASGPPISKGRLGRGYDADVIVVDGDLAADLTALRDVRAGRAPRRAGPATAGDS